MPTDDLGLPPLRKFGDQSQPERKVWVPPQPPPAPSAPSPASSNQQPAKQPPAPIRPGSEAASVSESVPVPQAVPALEGAVRLQPLRSRTGHRPLSSANLSSQPLSPAQVAMQQAARRQASQQQASQQQALQQQASFSEPRSNAPFTKSPLNQALPELLPDQKPEQRWLRFAMAVAAGAVVNLAVLYRFLSYTERNHTPTSTALVFVCLCFLAGFLISMLRGANTAKVGHGVVVGVLLAQILVIIADTRVDPTNHNLAPLELVIYAIGATPGYLGALAGAVMRKP